MPRISTILHNILLHLLGVALIMTVQPVAATEVRGIAIDPPSPAYNQPFKCALTLDQDDHRNACSLMPFGAAPGTFPWDICRIDHISADKLTRYYNCIANKARGVPGPGQYQIVVWNFTGDGETGQVTARQDITIRDTPLPSPTKQPTPTIIQLPSPTNTPLPTIPVISPTQSVLQVEPTIAPIITPSHTISPAASQIAIPLPDSEAITKSLIAFLRVYTEKTRMNILSPLIEVFAGFLEETRF